MCSLPVLAGTSFMLYIYNKVINVITVLPTTWHAGLSRNKVPPVTDAGSKTVEQCQVIATLIMLENGNRFIMIAFKSPRHTCAHSYANIVSPCTVI